MLATVVLHNSQAAILYISAAVGWGHILGVFPLSKWFHRKDNDAETDHNGSSLSEHETSQ